MTFRVDGVMVLTGVGVLGVGIAAYFIKKNGAAVAQAINPVSEKNVVNQGINNIAQSLGVISNGSSLGSALYDATHNEYDFRDPNYSSDFSWSKTLNSFAPALNYLTPASALGTVAGSKIGSAIGGLFSKDYSEILDANVFKPDDGKW